MSRKLLRKAVPKNLGQSQKCFHEFTNFKKLIFAKLFETFSLFLKFSVTRWLNYLFNIWPLTTTTLCTTSTMHNSKNIFQRKLKSLPNTR